MKFLHSAFVTSPMWLRNSCVNGPYSALSTSTDFNVGGKKFTIFEEDTRKYPSLILHQLLESSPVGQEIVINRSGDLFKYVNAFLVCGSLPRTDEDCIALDESTLQKLQTEAEFYGLQTMSNDCKVGKKRFHFAAYLMMKKYIDQHITNDQRFVAKRGGEIEFQHTSELTSVLKGIWSLFCLTGKLYHRAYFEWLMQNGPKVHEDDVLTAAAQSPFGVLGVPTEIDACRLNPDALKEVSDRIYFLEHLAPHLQLSLRPSKLVIHQTDYAHDWSPIVPKTVDSSHVGTLVVILNSGYTGGELEVTHGGRTEVVTGPYSWVAMYGDCLHKINPVTSGTRVSLIYDIHGSERERTKPCTEPCTEVDEYFEVENIWGFTLDRGLENCIQPTEIQQRQFLTSLQKEFLAFDTIILGLRHLYPEGQTDTAVLAGGDRVLYDMLVGSNEYEVQLVAATVFRSTSCNPRDRTKNFVQCKLYSPEILQRALRDEDSVQNDITSSPTKQPTSARSKLVLMDSLFPHNGTLHFIEEINDRMIDEFVSMVSGLQVRKKAL